MTTKSLRTVDALQKGSLLPNPANHEEGKVELVTPYVHVIKLFSPSECQEIIKTALEVGLAPLLSYPFEKRQSSRTCVLDEHLALIMWDRLGRHPDLFTMAPFGFNTEGTWVPYRLNKCFRVNSYEAPSVGFAPHFDNQYCSNENHRSVYTVIVYLNEDFLGGETELYLGSEADEVISGATVEEEIKAHGGLSSYTKIPIEPEIGHALIFPHHTLHAGNPLVQGTKYILRTDLVFRRVKEDPVRSLVPSEIRSYSLALETFREAQNQELLGNDQEASELYERSQSLRKSHRGFTSVKDIWLLIMEFLTFPELHLLGTVNHGLSSSTMCYRSIYEKRLLERLAASSPVDPKQPWSSLQNSGSLLYQPQIIAQVGCEIVLEFPNLRFFRQNKIACLRVATVLSLIARSQSPNDPSNSYLTHYNPVTQQILQCDIGWLLMCAFFELPCHGAYFRVNPIEPGKESLTAMVDDQKGDDRDQSPTEEDNVTDDIIDEPWGAESSEEEKESEEAAEIKLPTMEKPRISLISSSSTLHKGRVHQIFKSLTQTERTARYQSFINSVDSAFMQENFGIPLGEDLKSLLEDEEEPENSYGQKRTSGYDLLRHTHKVTVKGSCRCQCLSSTTSTQRKDLFVRVNNLVCDFYHHRLEIEKEFLDCVFDPYPPHNHNHYLAKLTPHHLNGFNHAACQCGFDDITPKSTSEERSTAFHGAHLVDHVHLFIKASQVRVFFHGVNAL